jgi:hypothetical protein
MRALPARPLTRLAVLVACVAGTTWPSTSAEAHGIWGHMHVTGWAIENLPPGDLRDFFADPVVRNAAHFGAAYCDSGYWPQSGSIQEPARNYGEHNHWEPFIEDFVQWIRVNDPPPWESLESRQRVAFLMGVAAHGMQDEIFDSLFLYEVEQVDSGSQDDTDPATDGFLVASGNIRFVPTPYIPMETVLELYEVLGDDRITEEVVQGAVDIMVRIYVNDTIGLGIAESQGAGREGDIPWTYAHYLDPSIPGSLRAEIIPTARYIESIWERLHDRWTDDELIVHAFPETNRRLRTHEHTRVASWITLVTGRGIESGTATIRVADSAGVTHPTALNGTRWGGNDDWGRLIRLLPEQDLQPGGQYTVELEPGLAIIGTDPLSTPWSMTFQVECTEANAADCPPLPDPFVAAIDGSGPGLDSDVGVDADAGADAGGSGDGGSSADAGTDTSDQGNLTTQPGEGCASAPGTPAAGYLSLAVGAALLAARRRRIATV